MSSLFKPYRFMKKQEIEALALAILEEIKQTSLFGLQFPVDTTEIAEKLGLNIVWETLPSEKGETIAAMILPTEKLIVVNEKIENYKEGFIQSTIGHELGHWILHVNQNQIAKYNELLKKGINLEVEPLLRESHKALQGREWQAQYFSSCLLMPEFILKEKTQNLDLTKWTNLYNLAKELGVTISNLTYRLRGLGWIKTEGKKIYQLSPSKKCFELIINK